MQHFNQTVIVRNKESLLKSHSVLRNTYILLGFTLLFSAACAGFAVVTQAGFGSAMLSTLVAFGLLFVTTSLRNSGWGILSVFAFTGCMGYSMGPMLNHFIRGYANGGQLIMMALAGTGITFFISSAYILVTKKELSSLGRTLSIGLIVCMIAIIANIFLKMPAIQLAVSTLLTFIATMLMMYDTSRIINNGETNYIMATISLFIDIQMLFQNLLMLLGIFNSKD
jgi:modulator of FtsH protease